MRYLNMFFIGLILFFLVCVCVYKFEILIDYHVYLVYLLFSILPLVVKLFKNKTIIAVSIILIFFFWGLYFFNFDFMIFLNSLQKLKSWLDYFIDLYSLIEN